MNPKDPNERQLKCYICNRVLEETDRVQVHSSTVKGYLKIIGFERSSTNSEVIEKVLACPIHPNFFLKKIRPPVPNQITFERRALSFIKRALGVRIKEAPSTILEGDCIYYNMFYSTAMRLSTYAGRFWKKVYTANLPLDSLVLLVSSKVQGRHFKLFGTYDTDRQKYVIVNIIEDG
jgi:hypothetical protein